MEEQSVDLRTIWSGMYNKLLSMGVEDIESVKSVMMSELGKYNVTKREETTDIVVYDSENKGYQMFFLAKRVEGLSKRTLEYYKMTVDRFFRTICKNASQVTTDDIRYYLAIRQVNDGVSITTTENERRNLCSFFGWLAEEDYIHKNPCKPIKKVKAPKVKKKAFTDVEIQKLKDACNLIDTRKTKQAEEKRLRMLALVEFMISTACRVGEISTLKRENVNLEQRTALVCGKGNKERTVFLTNVSKHRLIKYWEYVGEKEYAFSAIRNCSRNEENDHVFSISGIEIAIRQLGKIAGVPNCHPHRFRRTCATMAIKKGMTITEVQKMLGHENLDTTKIYLDLDDTEIKYQHDKYF